MQSLQFGYLVISRILEKDTLKGFLVVSSMGELSRITLDQVNQWGITMVYKNAIYDVNFKTLTGKNGVSLSNSPSINYDFVCTSKNGITVMCTILDMQTKKPIGVVAYNAMGQKFNLTYKKLNELASKYTCCNFDMKVDDKYGLIAVQKDGSYFETIEMEVPKRPTEALTSKSPVDQKSISEIPVIKAYTMDFIKDSEFNQPCQDKLVRAMLNMQKLTPYYYTILAAIPRKPAQLGTMGVTEDTLYYDMKFVANLSVSELTFVLIHEILHIAMQHSIRYGNKTNHDLWNIATDLYINSVICNDFGCKFGGGEVNIGTSNSPVTIKTPDFGVYIETIGGTIDLASDTPESIYRELLKENAGSTQQGSQGQPSNSGMQGGSGSQSGNQGQSGGQNQQGSQQSQAAQQLQQGSQNMNQGMQQLAQGAQQGQQVSNNSGQSQQANQQIQQGMNQIQQGVQQAMQGLTQGNQQQIQQGMQQAQQGLQQAQQGAQQMNNAMQQSQQGQSQQGQQASQNMQQGLQGIQQGLGQMQQGMQNLGQGIPSFGQGGHSPQGSGGQGMESPSANSQMPNKQSKDQTSNQGLNSKPADGMDDITNPDNGEFTSMQDVNVVYKGKKLKGSIMRDVMSKNKGKSKDDVQSNIDASRQALQKISTKIKMEEEELGTKLVKKQGSGAALTQRYIEVGLAAGVDWRVLFRNICKDKPKKTFTLANPNQDYMNMGMTVASRRNIGKPTRVSNVKFAIDVSGSVSREELTQMLSEINNIYTHFKLDGELIYWSTSIGDAGMFSSLKDMLKIRPETTGGTDVRCVFDYLIGNTKVHGKFEPDKPKDIKAIFILTDGCFSNNYAEFEHAFGRKVVWLITGKKGNTITFNPPFGRVLGLELD